MADRCVSCGGELPAAANFCPACGTRQPEEAPATSPPRQNISELQERRLITVVFCDLVGSTALSEKMDAEDYADLIERYQTAIADVTQRGGGYVAKYMGDGALLYFGYPLAIENTPVHAIQTALELMEELRKLSADLEDRIDRELAIRVGIHTGMVIAGRMGKTEFSEERAIVGVTPNVAARLQAIAKPGRIVISGATRKRIEAGYHTESLGQVKLRGLKEPIEAFVVGAEKPVVDARGVGAAGREAELAALDRLWSGLSAGSFVRASLIGVPGIGKSTVVRTFLARLSKGKGGGGGRILR